METQDILKLVGLAAVDVVAFLVFWLLALRTKNPKLKEIAKYIVVFGFAYIAMYSYVLYEKNAPRLDFVTDAAGPAKGIGSVTSKVTFHVAEVGEVHHVELTPRANAEEMAKGKIDLYYKLENRQGKVVSEAVLEAEAAEGRQWRTLKFPFTPEEAGDYLLMLAIPAGVDLVHIVVKEPR